MKPVDQVRTGPGIGQCTEAALASLLGVALNEVPDLCDALGRRSTERFTQLLEWLWDTHQKAWIMYLFPAVSLPLEMGRVGTELRGMPVDGFCLLGGENPLGIPHYVVGRAGALVHDPNPSRAGLKFCDEVSFLLDLSHPQMRAALEKWGEGVCRGGVFRYELASLYAEAA